MGSLLWLCVVFECLMKMGQMMIFVKIMFWGKFYMELSVFSCLEMFRQTLGSNLGIGKSKLGFWGENSSFSRDWTVITRSCEQAYSQQWVTANSQWRVALLAVASCHRTVFPVFSFSCLLTRFCFEMVFGANMEIVDNIFIFLRALVLLEYDFWFASYGEITLETFYWKIPHN